SPMNFSGRPRSAMSSADAASKKRPSTSRARSASKRWARRGESPRSAKSTVTTLRSSVATNGPAAAPQLGQNRAASGSGRPQTAHALTIPSENMLHCMADPKIKALGQVPLFEHLTSRELGFIAREGDEVDVPAGKVLIREGRPGDTFYVILDGQAEVVVGRKLRRVLKPGDFFGEISMIDRGLGTAT